MLLLHLSHWSGRFCSVCARCKLLPVSNTSNSSHLCLAATRHLSLSLSLSDLSVPLWFVLLLSPAPQVNSDVWHFLTVAAAVAGCRFCCSCCSLYDAYICYMYLPLGVFRQYCRLHSLCCSFYWWLIYCCLLAWASCFRFTLKRHISWHQLHSLLV